MPLFDLDFSFENFDIFLYHCYYWRYLIETQSSCSLSKGEPISVVEVILHFFLQSYAPFSTYNFLNAATAERFASACGALVFFSSLSLSLSLLFVNKIC